MTNTQLLLQSTTITTILSLVYLSYWDLKYKKLPIYVIVSLLIYGMINQLMLITDIKSWAIEQLITIGLFGFLYLVSILSKEELGKGDVLLFLAIALVFGWQFAVVLYVSSFVLVGIYGVFLLIFLKMSKKTEIPLLPFLLISFMALVII